jgi:hypothetical protein
VISQRAAAVRRGQPKRIDITPAAMAASANAKAMNGDECAVTMLPPLSATETRDANADFTISIEIHATSHRL